MEGATNGKPPFESPNLESLRCKEISALLVRPGVAPELTEKQTRSIESQEIARKLWEDILDEYRRAQVMQYERNDLYDSEDSDETDCGSACSDTVGSNLDVSAIFPFFDLPAKVRNMVYEYYCKNDHARIIEKCKGKGEQQKHSNRSMGDKMAPMYRRPPPRQNGNKTLSGRIRKGMVPSEHSSRDVLAAYNEYEFQHNTDRIVQRANMAYTMRRRMGRSWSTLMVISAKICPCSP